MTREETKRLLAIIDATYSNWHAAEGDRKTVVDAWYAVLLEERYADMQNALLAFIRSDTKGFAPTPGQLIARKLSLTTEPEDVEYMIFRIREAVKNSNYNSVGEYDRLPEIAQKAVGSPENLRAYASQDLSEFESVTCSHLRRAVQRAYDTQRVMASYDSRTKKVIERALGGGSVPQIADEMREVTAV